MSNALFNNYRKALLSASAPSWNPADSGGMVLVSAYMMDTVGLDTGAYLTLKDLLDNAVTIGLVTSTKSNAITNRTVGVDGTALSGAIVFDELTANDLTSFAVFEDDTGTDPTGATSPLLFYVDELTPASFSVSGGTTTITPSGGGFFRV